MVRPLMTDTVFLAQKALPADAGDIAVADDAIAEIVGRNRHDHILNLACRSRIERSAHTAVADGRTCRRNARDQSHTHMHLFVGSRTYILDQGGESLAPRNR